MKEYTFRTNGEVCSQVMRVTVDENKIITSLQVEGGCPGNLQGICQLVRGRKITEVIDRLSGIRCADRSREFLRKKERPPFSGAKRDIPALRQRRSRSLHCLTFYMLPPLGGGFLWSKLSVIQKNHLFRWFVLAPTI